ncbi:hypothetical protein [Oleisolibacter albus]|uniref:hypothetical protein n=1 Tax=Oleisolibacter albus TaxID=2171757 RepID=UPI000DF4BF29|nr:hypothetical protein [Oleisolibacter albus]
MSLQFPSVRPLSLSAALGALILTLPLTLGPAAAQTLGDIAKQADQPKATAKPQPAPKAPTLGDVAKQAEAAPHAAATPRPATLPALPTLGDVAKQAEAAPHAAATPGCERPKRPERAVDGRAASEAEMRAAQAEVKTFVEQSTAFNACIDQLVKENYARITAGEYLALVRQQDLTFVLMQAVADRFNEQLRLFKARGQ